MDYSILGGVCVLVFFVCIILNIVITDIKKKAKEQATDQKIKDLEAKVKDENKPADKPEEKK
jgi:cell division protein FtsL